MARDQNTQLRGVALQPQGVTAEPMVRGAEIKPSSMLGDFLTGLGKLSPSVQNLANTRNAILDDPQAKKDAEINAKYDTQGKTPEEIAAMQKNGDHSVLSERATNKMLGMSAANAAVAELSKRRASGEDFSTFDFDGWVKDQTEKNKGLIGTDTSARAGWLEGIGGDLRGRVMSQVAQAQGANETAKKEDALTGFLTTGLQRQIDEGNGDPKKLDAFLRDGMKAGSAFALAPYEKQRELLANQLQAFRASGNVAAIEAIGRIDRGGNQNLAQQFGAVYTNALEGAKLQRQQDTNKAALPFLDTVNAAADAGQLTKDQIEQYRSKVVAGDPNYSKSSFEALQQKNAAAVHAQITATASEQRKTAAESVIQREGVNTADAVDAGLGDIIETQDYVSEPLADGSVVKVTGKEMKEAAFEKRANERGAAAAAQATKDGKDPLAAEREARFNTYAKSGLLEPKTEVIVKGLFNRSTLDGKPTDADRIGLQEMLMARRNNPAVLSTVIKGDVQEAMAATADYYDSIGTPPDEIIAAMRLTRDNWGTRKQLPVKDRDAMVETVKTSMVDSGLFSSGNVMGNEAMVNHYIERNLNVLYAASNGDTDAMTRMATDALKNQTVTFKGALVDTQGLPGIPNGAAAKPVFEDAETMFKAHYPEYAKQDISFVRDGTSNRFFPVTATGAILHGDPVTWDDMQRGSKEMRAATRKAEAAEANKAGVKNAEDQLLARPTRQLSPDQRAQQKAIADRRAAEAQGGVKAGPVDVMGTPKKTRKVWKRDRIPAGGRMGTKYGEWYQRDEEYDSN